MNDELLPDREQISSFIRTIFAGAAPGTFVSLRSFHHEGSKAFRITPVRIVTQGFEQLIEAAFDDAHRAAKAVHPIVFCPPLATFSDKKRAREKDLAQAFTLSVECDQHPHRALETLQQILGPATIVVASGGEWIDSSTGELHPKLHLHWLLNKPATGLELAALKRARKLATGIAGGDPTNVSAVHPIRWPGSWHRKGMPRLCRIVEQRSASIELNNALEVLAKHVGKSESASTRSETDDRCSAKLIRNILTGESYHPSLVPLAARLLGSGMYPGAVVKLLESFMNAVPEAARDARWFLRRSDIPRVVNSAQQKWGANEPVEPVDLWARFEPPTLPHDVLPKVIEDLALVQGEMMGADPGGLATAALAICAAAIPDRIRVQVKQHDRSWTEPARIWVALIGSPSTKKTPIISTAAKPLLAEDHALWRRYAAAKAEYDALSAEERKATPPPKQTRLRLEDTSIEAAQEVLKDSTDGLLCFQDEISGWFGSMDKYSGNRGAAKDRGFWLQAFNGGSYAINRIGRGSSFIENLSVCLLGGIQPEPIRQLAAEGVDDGLLQRLLPVVLRPATLGRDEPVPPITERYADVVRQLLRLRDTPLQKLYIGSGTLLLHLSEGAQTVRRQLERRHLELMDCEAVHRKLAAHVGKYDGLFARLCVLFHCIDHASLGQVPTCVSESTAKRVADFMHRFLLPHALTFYAGTLGLSDEHDRLSAVAGYILAHGLEQITNRDVQRGDRAMRGLERHQIESVLDQLDALGWVSRLPGARPSDPPRWRVNPECHRKFALRGRQEAERRENTRKLIAELAQRAG